MRDDIENTQCYREGWNFGLDYPASTHVFAARAVENRAISRPGLDFGAWWKGRNAAVVAYWQNEREEAAEAAGRE
jgi:hypothetical protein